MEQAEEHSENNSTGNMEAICDIKFLYLFSAVYWIIYNYKLYQYYIDIITIVNITIVLFLITVLQFVGIIQIVNNVIVECCSTRTLDYLEFFASLANDCKIVSRQVRKHPWATYHFIQQFIQLSYTTIVSNDAKIRAKMKMQIERGQVRDKRKLLGKLKMYTKRVKQRTIYKMALGSSPLYQILGSILKETYKILYTAVCNLASINTGMIMGYSSVVLPILTNNTSSIFLNEMEIPLFVSIIPISIIFGCIFYPLAMYYGRRYHMIIFSIISTLGWSLIASSYNVPQLFVGRVLTGLAVGVNAHSTEMYLEEISIASWKDVITVTPQVSLTVGILIIYFLGFVIENHWRLTTAFSLIPSLSLALWNIFFICESPVWLLSKGRKEAARITLLRIRGLHQETIEFQEEFARMVNYNELTNNFETSQNCQSDSSSTKEKEMWSFLIRSKWSKLKSIQRVICLPEVWKPFVILNLYFLLQQFSGLYVIVSYSVDIITRLNITINPFLITVLIGIIQIVGAVIMACCSTRIGRRPMSIVSGVGISIFLGILLVYLEFFENTGITAIPLACIFLFVGFGSFGIFSLPLSLIAELYPTKYINVLGQLTTLFCNVCNYIVLQLYPMMVTQHRNATFYFYFIICIIITFFLMIALPETHAKTKTEIEEAFRDKSEIKETFRKIEDAQAN